MTGGPRAASAPPRSSSPSSTSACRRSARASCRPSGSRRWSRSIPLHVRACERLLARPAAGVRGPGGDLHRVRLLLGVLDCVGRARAPVRRDDPRAARARPGRPRRRARLERRLPPPALRRAPGSDPRDRSGGERGDGGRGARRADARRVLRRRDGAAARRRGEARRARRRATTSSHRCPTSTTSSPASRSSSRPDGTATFEFPHLLRLLDGLQYDTIYHEHFSYFSLATIGEIFRAHGLEVYDVEELWTHGGSLRVYAQHVGRAARGRAGRRASCSRARTTSGLRSPRALRARSPRT